MKRKNVVIALFTLAIIVIFVFRNFMGFKLLTFANMIPGSMRITYYDELFGLSDQEEVNMYIDPLTIQFEIKPAGTAGDYVVYKITDKDTIIYTSHFETPARVCDNIDPLTYNCGVSNW